MTEHDQFAARLRAALDDKADQAPRKDLADGAIALAGRIRTRRRVAGLVAVVVTAAAAVPVGAAVVDRLGAAGSSSTASHSGRPVEVNLAALSAGDPPQVPYLEQDSYVDDGQTQTVQPIPGSVVQDAVRLGNGLAVFSANSTSSVTVSTDAGASLLPRGGTASNPVIDSSTSEAPGSAAWAIHSKAAGKKTAPDTMVYADSTSGEPATTPLGSLRVEHIIGVHSGVIVFNATDHGTSVVGRVSLAGSSVVAAPRKPWPSVLALSAVDSGYTLMAGRTTDMVGDRTGCTAMMSYADASVLWQSCLWRPVDFSPDSSLVFAVPTSGPAADAGDVAIMDADTGEVLQVFDTRGTFGRASFDGNAAVDIVLAEHRRSAIVRCSVGGSCELATDPLPIGPAGSGSLVYPYQLTANP